MRSKVLCAKACAILRLGLVLGCLGLTGSLWAQYSTELTHDGKAKLQGLEQVLHLRALTDARAIAAMYAHAGANAAPGVRAYGEFLTGVLAISTERLDFSQLVSRNALCWWAGQELAPRDASFPYLVAMLSVLSGEETSASRILALAQAAMPLSPQMRRVYARPEALLLVIDHQMGENLPPASDLKTVDEALAVEHALTGRLAWYPQQSGLLWRLLEVKTRAVQLADLADSGEAADSATLGKLLDLTPKDWEFVRRNDPIMYAGLAKTPAEWRQGRTLTQLWMRWIRECEPADFADIEESAALCDAVGRADLAWLFERIARSSSSVFVGPDERRWAARAHELLGPVDVDRLIAQNAMNKSRGVITFDVPYDPGTARWTGDPNAHPMLIAQTERQLALIDTTLAVTEPGSLTEARLRFQRAETLEFVDAWDESRWEMDRFKAIRGETNILVVLRAAAFQAHQGNFGPLLKMYERGLKENKRLEPQRIEYAFYLWAAGQWREARQQYTLVAQHGSHAGYGAIYADLLARRDGRREIGLLNAAAKTQPGGPWVATGLRYCLGEIDENQLLSAARSDRYFTTLQHECEGWFWIAQTRLADGDRDGAIHALRRCVATGFVSYLEYRMAKAQLRTLVPESEQPVAPRDDRGVILG